ncbi:MAG: hypothetical protein KDB33_01590 [Acidimicrobiales bacterium]|nr:hypothetical protein [Acidimicrobiales bacterium]
MPEPAGDLDVDVLIVGGSVLGHYLAAELGDRYSVCLLTDPAGGDEALESDGLLSAGYRGTDVGRIQPARRAAGYWKLWAENHDIAYDAAPSLLVVPPDEEVARVRFWLDAALHVEREGPVPSALRGGSASSHVCFRALDDVVLDPAAMVRALRARVEDSCVTGEVVDVTLANDSAVDAVEASIDGQIVPIVARYTVFAADAANADLLAKVAARTRNAISRRERAEAARTCQAVRKQLQLFVRGPGLPLVTASVDGLQIVAHRASSTDVVWIVTPEIDDAATTLGPEDLRFTPQLDRDAVAALLGRLVDVSPLLEEQAATLRWAARVRRKTEHPMMAGPGAGAVGRPSPAKIESMGLEGFAALWPGHVSYAMIVGDVAAERIVEHLGRPGGFDHADVARLARPGLTLDLEARFVSEDLEWKDWGAFRSWFSR